MSESTTSFDTLRRCSLCASPRIVRFTGRWGSGLNWAEDAVLCADCGEVQAEDSACY